VKVIIFKLPKTAHRTRSSPVIPANASSSPVIWSDAAPFWSPGLPVVAAAPCAPVASGVSVTGALTTTTDVEVSTLPFGKVVKNRSVDVLGVKETPMAEEVNVTRPPPKVLKMTAPFEVETSVAEAGVEGATITVVAAGTVSAKMAEDSMEETLAALELD